MPADNFDDEDHDAPQGGQGGPEQGRQHRYTTKDMKPERPWKRWCLQCLCCLIIIAIMIILSIYMQKLFDPDEDEDWTDDKPMHDDDMAGVEGELSGAASPLPKNMEYIEDVCSEERVGRNDKTECETACEPAKDCCDPFKNGGNSTCLEEELAGCFTYAKCHSLNGFLDPAHNDLDRICSKASLEINPDECILACETLECCYKDEESCISHNFQACMDYSACQNLKEDSIDVAPMDLDERCSKDNPSCKRDCREALACSDPNSKAYRENFVTCLSYSACTGHSDTKITVAPIYSRVPAAPATLQEACSDKGIGQWGVDKCLEECALAQVSAHSYGVFVSNLLILKIVCF